MADESTEEGIRPGKAAAPRMAREAAAVLQDFDLWEGVLIGLLVGTVSHEHELQGNDRQKSIT
jgi:hypothetical protein